MSTQINFESTTIGMHILLEANTKFKNRNIDYIKKIVESEEFKEEPIHCIVNLMIQEDGEESLHCRTHSFIALNIPNFCEEIQKEDFLLKHASVYYNNEALKDIIMTCFENSIKNSEFKNHLKSSASHLQNFIDDSELKISLSVFNQARDLKSFSPFKETDIEDSNALFKHSQTMPKIESKNDGKKKCVIS